MNWKATHCQNLKSTNDVNGNPRRLWVIYDARKDPAFPIEVINEGYGGEPEECRSLIHLTPVRVSPKEHKVWLKMYEGGDKE